jgi:hypothetical protein
MPPTNVQTARRGRNSGSPAIRQEGCRPTGEEPFPAVLQRLMKARGMSESTAPMSAGAIC